MGFSSRGTERLAAIAAVLLLCQCATKHQPVAFAPYFSDGLENAFGPRQVAAARELASREELSGLEKRRLLQLYALELRGLRGDTARYEWLSQRARELWRETEPVDRPLVRMQLDALAERATRWVPRLRAARAPAGINPYEEARKLWNADQNQAASKRLESWMASPGFRRQSGSSRARAWYLKFRLALDLGQWSAALSARDEVVKAERCGWRGAHATFLSSLLAFSQGDPRRAAELLAAKCESPSTAYQRLRDRYWLTRFRYSAGDPDAREEAEALASHPIPAFYHLMAQKLVAGRFHVQAESRRAYLSSPFPVPSRAHEAFLEAERMLAADLRPEAALYIRLAARSLPGGLGSAPARLYAAHLLQATGEHLEALRLYASVASAWEEHPPEGVSWEDLNFNRDMFPRPFEARVRWLGHLWKVEPDFVYAIMRQESGFHPTAVSRARAQGLMQMMPFLSGDLSAMLGYGPYYQQKHMLTAEENLKLATFHLYQLRSVAPHPALVAAAYNAGIQRLEVWWRRFGHLPVDAFIEFIPFRETREYVKAVLRNFVAYRCLDEGKPVDASFLSDRLPVPKALSRG